MLRRYEKKQNRYSYQNDLHRIAGKESNAYATATAPNSDNGRTGEGAACNVGGDVRDYENDG